MHVLVITTASRTAWFDVARAAVEDHHPGAAVTPVLCDGRLLAPRRDAICPQGERIGRFRFADLVLALSELEAGWAALPWLLDAAGIDGPVVVMSDTVSVMGPLDDAVAAAQATGAAARARHRDAPTALSWGGCLPGFVALASSTAPLLQWWRHRLPLLLDPDVSEPVEAMWRDLPSAAHQPLGDPGLRLSSRTAGLLELDLLELELHDDAVGVDGAIAVDGEPLVLADLDGLDPSRPWWFAPRGGSPQAYTSESPALRELLRRHAAALHEAGWSPQDGTDRAVPGLAETPELRRWYRGLLSAEHLPPNPYVAGEVEPFLKLLTADRRGGTTGISAYADLVMEQRPDLRAAFPTVRWSGRDDFVRWMWSHGLDEGETSLALLPDLRPPAPRVRVAEGPLPFGVNLVGYLTGELGLGVAARRMKAALEAVGVPVATVSYDRTSSRMRDGADRSLHAPYLANLLVITPDQLPYFVEDVGPAFFEGHHNIGLWYWETDVMTSRQLSSFAWVDEVWGATTYLRDIFERPGRVPVTHVPVPLVFDDPGVTPEDRTRLGLDDRFTVLFSFDFLSVVERKNPLGLIEAYCGAFGPDDGARLIIKGINGDVFPDKREQLIDAAADRPDIDVWDRYLSARDRLALVALADCYASLHRSEGLGLTMAEAMALGTPVVATAYSGNLDFMDERSALLVPATEVLIGPGHLYPSEGHWAEPDLAVASSHLRRLFDDAALREQLAAAAPTALEPYGLDAVGDVALRRLRAVGQQR